MEYFFLKKTVFPLVYPSKHSSWWRRTEGVLKTSWRHNCKTSCKLVLKTSWRRLENILKTSCRTSWKRFRKTYRKYVLKTSSRRLGRRKVLRWRRLGKQEMFAGTCLSLSLSQSDYILLVNRLWCFSWKLLLLLEKYCQSHLMKLIQLIDCWRTVDEFRWNLILLLSKNFDMKRFFGDFIWIFF